MSKQFKDSQPLVLVSVGLASWLIPGAGYLMLKESRRAVIVFVTITLTFLIGLYVGSIGVIDPLGAKPWYIAQLMNSPLIMILGQITKGGAYPVYAKPNEIGQIYTSIAGLLNLLCIVNAVYFAYLSGNKSNGK